MGIILVGKTLALVCTLAGLYLSIKKDWQKSSVAWSVATAILWILSIN